MTLSYTNSSTFTITHAKYIASKIATDLMRISRYYGGTPGPSDISKYEEEAIALLRVGALGTVTYGFQRAEKWITPTIKYSAAELDSALGIDDDPGRISIGADISGAIFTSYLTYSKKWSLIPVKEQLEILNEIPVKRVGANEPGVSGYFSSDKAYSAGGRSINRSSVRSY